ncbi:MAG: endonuclease III [Bacteroidetes bacterium]|nr:endonuclease III [Bacteroidota bacterium]
MTKINWSLAIKPLLRQYKGRKHPLEYKNLYQLLVMVVLSAQDSDRHINSLAPDLFNAFPNMKALAATNPESLFPYVSRIRNFGNKTKWLLEIARQLKTDKGIPLTMDALTALPGIGRKSANVIMREAGAPAEGIAVDLHVLRVAPRLGIASGTDPKKIEAQMMDVLPQAMWAEAGMAISFLGRETCRPSEPKHHECIMKAHCAYFKSLHGKAIQKAAAAKKPVAAKAETAKKATKKAVAKKTTASRKK